MRDTSISDRIKSQVGKYLKQKRRATYFELGLCKHGRLRADVFSISMSGHVVIVEVKSSVQDFKSDKKFHLYVEYANKLYFAMPNTVYDKVKDQIPKNIGVFIMTSDGEHIQQVKGAKEKEISKEIVFNLAIRAAFRTQSSTSKNKKL